MLGFKTKVPPTAMTRLQYSEWVTTVVQDAAACSVHSPVVIVKMKGAGSADA